MSAQEEASPSPMPDGEHAAAAPARGATLIVTNLTKVAGLVIAVHEAFTTKDAIVMGVAAFMMAGAVASEAVLLALIDRVLGRGK